MDYMTLNEASEKWGITPLMINYYCAKDRIPGAEKIASVWLLSRNAEKSLDKRRKDNLNE